MQNTSQMGQILNKAPENLRKISKILLSGNFHSETLLDSQVTYGLELEFLASRSPGLLHFYRTDDVDAQAWEACSLDERVAHVLSWRESAVKNRRQGTARLLRLPSCASSVGSSFPQELTLEPNGVLEMRKHPFSSCADVALFLADVLEYLGVPQAQVHLVFPRAVFSGDLTPEKACFTEANPFPLLSLALSDRAQFAKLCLDVAAGGNPAASFVSGFLPPFDSASFGRLERQTRWLGQEQELGDVVKFVCAPVLRSSVLYGLPGHVGIEVRQWDVPTGPEAATPELLLGLVADVEALTQWLVTRRLPSGLAPWAATPPSHELCAWERVGRLCASVQMTQWTRVLDAIEFLLTRRNAGNQKANPRSAFLFPLRPFDVSFPALASQIQEAQRDYVQKLLAWEKTMESTNAMDFERRATVDALLLPLRIALSDFGKASGLGAQALQEVFGQWGMSPCLTNRESSPFSSGFAPWHAHEHFA